MEKERECQNKSCKCFTACKQENIFEVQLKSHVAITCTVNNNDVIIKFIVILVTAVAVSELKALECHFKSLLKHRS